MKLALKDLGKRQGRGKRRGRGMTALFAHRVFALLLGLWGMALGGLSVMVLPRRSFRFIVDVLPEAVPDRAVQPVLAILAAIVLAATMFVVGKVITVRVRRAGDTPPIVRAARRHIRPIDPARDLGSRSLDDPLDTDAFAGPAWHEESDEAAMPQPAPDPRATSHADSVETTTEPLELDLAAFAAMPGRNAVWVEEPAPAAAAGPAAAEMPVVPAPVAELRDVGTALPEPGAAALARLRAIPPDQLSLAEMVERFAGALQERRASPPARALSAADLAAREAALGEALKALAALSGVANDKRVGREEPLRAALAQLRSRGAA